MKNNRKSGISGNEKVDFGLLYACKLAYRKHHLDDESIGWEELSNILLDAICNEIGTEGYQQWLESLKD